MTPNMRRAFTIHSCLGRGGFGEVFLAKMRTSSGLETDVALKVLRADIDLKDDAVRRLKDEGRLLGALNHPAILRVLDLAHVEGRVALVTEYVPGADLDVLFEQSDFPLKALLETVSTVAEALHEAYTHTKDDGQMLRLIHRDIKPSNIRISRHGAVRLLDFGIAWSEDTEREAHTAHNSAVGSLSYMSPERFGRNTVSSSADLYSLGCVLFEGLFKQKLFDNVSPIEMLRRADSHEQHDRFIRDRLSELREQAHLPEEAVTLMLSLLSFTPTDRPTARELSERCEALIDSLSGLSLKAWARTHSWPSPSELSHSWSQKTLEDTGVVLAGSGTQALNAEGLEDINESSTFSFSLDEDTGSAGQINLDEDSSAGQHTLSLDFAPSNETLSFNVSPERRRAVGLLSGAVVLCLGLFIAVFAPSQAHKEHKQHQTAAQTSRESPPIRATVERTAVVPAEAPPPPVKVVDPPKIVVEPTVKIVEPIVKRIKPVKKAQHAARIAEPTAPPPKVVKPSPVITGQFTGQNDTVPIELRTADQRFNVGAVPIGRYHLWADFGAGLRETPLIINIAEGQRQTVQCNPLKFTCELI